MTRGDTLDAARWVSRYVGPGAVAAIVGLLLAHGGMGIPVAGALAGGLVLVLAMQSLGFRALTAWLVVGVIAFPFVRYPHQHAVITFDRLWILSLGVALLLTKAGRLHRSAASRRLTTSLLLLTLALLIRAALTVQPRNQVELVLDTAVLPVILYLAAWRFVIDRTQWDRLARAFAAAGAILGAIATAEFIIGFHLGTIADGNVPTGDTLGTAASGPYRVAGPYNTDDALAVALLVCLAATFLWVQTSPRSRWKLGALALTLELAGITFTFFRGAFIAALVVILVTVGLRPGQYRRFLVTAALLAATAFVLVGQAQDSAALASRVNNTQNVSGRAATYVQAWALFRRHPMMGVGISQFGVAQTSELMVESVAGVEAVSSPHDSYLEALSEGGLLVIVPLLAVTVASVALIHRYRKLGAGDKQEVLIGAAVAAAGLGYLIMSLEETVIISSTASNAFLAILFGACARRLDVLERDRHQAAG